MNDPVPTTGPERPAAEGSTTGHLTEIFCSIQGEGLYVGQAHAFCRIAGCSLGCSWCDTKGDGELPKDFVVYGREKTVHTNPVDAGTAAGEILRVAREAGRIDTVSITGGEPLEQPEFVAELARLLAAAGKRVYLETNGIHARALKTVLPFVDTLAMDVKLPSATGAELWARHEAFLSCLE